MDETAALSCVPTTTYDGTPICSWNSNASTRGTLDILWLCASTLVLCIWNAVHHDIPSPGTSWWRIACIRIWWLIIALLVPEVLVLKALAQFRQARMLLDRVSQETRVPTKFPWWTRLKNYLRRKFPCWMRQVRQYLRRKFPCWMRQVRQFLRRTPFTENELLRRDENPSLPSTAGATSTSLELNDLTKLLPAHVTRTSLPGTSPEPGSDARKHPWTLTHSFYAVMHGFVTSDGGDAFWSTIELQSGRTVPFFDVQKGIQHITAPSHDAARIPDLSADDLNDRNKAGLVARLFLTWQLFVFIANCVVRLKQGLPLSLLEIKTFAHCLCSLIALALWGYKPHGVDVVAGTVRTRSLQPSSKPANWAYFDSHFSPLLPGADSSGILSFIVTVLAISVFYGLPHLLGRHVHFPFELEHRLWVYATYVVIGYPLTASWISFRCARRFRSVDVVFPLVHIICGMYLVGESVRQVFALPEGCFHTTQFIRILHGLS